jgi:hypothetical protein
MSHPLLWLRAAAHEVRCAECRVSWSSWLGRLLTRDHWMRARTRRRTW